MPRFDLNLSIYELPKLKNSFYIEAEFNSFIKQQELHVKFNSQIRFEV